MATTIQQTGAATAEVQWDAKQTSALYWSDDLSRWYQISAAPGGKHVAHTGASPCGPDKRFFAVGPNKPWGPHSSLKWNASCEPDVTHYVVVWGRWGSSKVDGERKSVQTQFRPPLSGSGYHWIRVHAVTKAGVRSEASEIAVVLIPYSDITE